MSLYKDDDKGLSVAEQLCGQDVSVDEAIELVSERIDAFNLRSVKRSVEAYQEMGLDLPDDLREEAASLGLL